MAEQSNVRVRVGGFVAVAVVALTGLIVLFGGAPAVFNNRAKYFVNFPETPGVTVGTPVRKSGVRIGQVTALDINDDSGKVRLTVELDNKYLPRQNEEPAISRGLLNGDTSIDFIPKVDEKGVPLVRLDAYPPGSSIDGIPPLNTARLISKATDAIPNAQEALTQFSSTVSKFQNVGPKAEAALDEISLFVKSAREVLPEIRETNKRLQEFIGSADAPPDVRKIAAGDAAAPPIDDKEAPANLRTLTKEVQEFVTVLRPIAEDVRKLLKDNQGELTATLKSIRTMTDRASDLLNDDNRKALANTLRLIETAGKDLLTDENRKAITAIIANLKDGSGELAQTIRLIKIVADRADSTLKEVNGTVKEFNARVVETKGVISNLDKATKPLADNVEPVMKNIATAADELAKTVAEARTVIALLSNTDGTFNKVLSDPQLYNQLVDATANLNRTLIRTERIAKDLEVFADKVARKPETIGLGGALRPSTGLKEAPTAPLPNNIPYPKAAPATGRTDGLRPIAPVPGGAELTPIAPTSSFKIDPRAADPLPPVRPQPIFGEPVK